MQDQNECSDLRSLREATMQYLELMPTTHRGLLQLMAKEYDKPAYALVASAIERLIVEWTRQVAPTGTADYRVQQRRYA
jgi:hypothetical protein